MIGHHAQAASSLARVPALCISLSCAEQGYQPPLLLERLSSHHRALPESLPSTAWSLLQLPKKGVLNHG